MRLFTLLVVPGTSRPKDVILSLGTFKTFEEAENERDLVAQTRSDLQMAHELAIADRVFEFMTFVRKQNIILIYTSGITLQDFVRNLWINDFHESLVSCDKHLIVDYNADLMADYIRRRGVSPSFLSDFPGFQTPPPPAPNDGELVIVSIPDPKPSNVIKVKLIESINNFDLAEIESRLGKYGGCLQGAEIELGLTARHPKVVTGKHLCTFKVEDIKDD
jgi:hypothetical protein